MISSYDGQGALRQECKASKHAVVYLKGTIPMMLPEERDRGMTEEPVMIEPTGESETMSPFSRLRFGKIYSIEWNTNMRDIGMVASSDRARLLRYLQESTDYDFDPDEESGPDPVPFSVGPKVNKGC
jgi:hypothetical protein